MKRSLFFAVTLLFSVTIFAQTPILGEWITVDDATGEQKSVVRIYQADNGKYYGTIIQLFEENGDAALCTECTGEDYNQPIVGLTIIRDMHLKDGDIISIDIGAEYKGYHGDCAKTHPCGKAEKFRRFP